MTVRTTFLLPVDDRPTADRPMAPGVARFAGLAVGVVDNQLWKSMPLLTSAVLDVFAAEGAHGEATQPFDHLSAEFADQQAALAPLAARIGAVVTGLGN